MGEGADFEGVIDLVGMTEIRWDLETEGEKFEVVPVSDKWRAQAMEWRKKCSTRFHRSPTRLPSSSSRARHVPADLVKKEIRRATIARDSAPFICGASRRNTGIQPLIDAIVDYLPAPHEVPPAVGFHTKKEEEVDVPCKADGVPLGLVFKIQYDREAGSLCYVRMYSGKIKTGDQVFNVGKKKRERVNRILRMHSNKSDPMDSVEAGDIAVFIGLKLAQTGDTVGSEGMPILLEKMHFPEPVISVSIEPKTMSERDKLKETLEILARARTRRSRAARIPRPDSSSFRAWASSISTCSSLA